MPAWNVFVGPLALFFVPALSSGQAPLPSLQATAKPVTDVRLTIRFQQDKSLYRIGERIPVDLIFTSATAGKYRVVGNPAAAIAWWDVSPAEGVRYAGDPCRPGPGGFFSGDLDMRRLDKPVTLRRDLNEYVLFEQPGTYRLEATHYSLLQAPDSSKDQTLRWLYGAPRQAGPVRSNSVLVTIVPRNTEEDARTLSAALRVLNSDARFEERREAARTIRFLGTENATRAMAVELSKDQSGINREFELGILESPHRKQATQILEQGLAEPGAAVTGTYVETLVRLVSCESYPLRGIARWRPDDLEARARAEQQRREIEPQLNQWQEEVQRTREHYYAVLAAALPRKREEARAPSLQALIQFAYAYRDLRPAPEWLPAVRKEAISIFGNLPPIAQYQFLDQAWPLIADPGLLPVLRELCCGRTRARALVSNPALKRLAELAPDEGRKRILDRVTTPAGAHELRPSEIFTVLPEGVIPEFDAPLASALTGGGGSPPFIAQFIARYATKRVLPEIREYYARAGESMVCNPGLVAYFLRVDRPFGEERVRALLKERPMEGPGHCARLLQNMRLLAPPEALADLAVEHLMDPRVPVKTDAAVVAGQLGSKDAEEPLWDALAYWHKWWMGRESEMNRENWYLEHTLRQAITGARAWVMTPDRIDRLEALCLLPDCETSVKSLRRMWEKPLALNGYRQGVEQIRFTVGGYGPLTEEQARNKLLQFPKGMRFRPTRLTLDGDVELALEQLRQFARDNGMVVEPR